MPNLASSKKDIRRTKKKSAFNDRLRVRVKKAVKNFNTQIANNNVEKATEFLPNAIKVIDKAAQKKVIKKDNASRKISRLTKKLNKIITAANVETAKKSA